MMTVEQLIDALQGMPSGATVMVVGGEGLIAQVHAVPGHVAPMTAPDDEE